MANSVRLHFEAPCLMLYSADFLALVCRRRIAVLQTGKRMVKEMAQQVPGAPYAAGSSIKPQTTYQRFCQTALVQ